MRDGVEWSSVCLENAVRSLSDPILAKEVRILRKRILMEGKVLLPEGFETDAVLVDFVDTSRDNETFGFCVRKGPWLFTSDELYEIIHEVTDSAY